MRAACLQLPDPNHRSVVSMSCTRIPLKEQTEPAQMHMTGEHASDLRCMSESARQQLVGTAFACRSKIVEPTSVQISDRRWTRTGRRLPGRRGDTVATGLQTYELRIASPRPNPQRPCPTARHRYQGHCQRARCTRLRSSTLGSRLSISHRTREVCDDAVLVDMLVCSAECTEPDEVVVPPFHRLRRIFLAQGPHAWAGRVTDAAVLG